MTPMGKICLEFSPEHNALSKGKELRDGLSVALQIGNTLWVTNDETISLERLTLEQGLPGDPCQWAARRHTQFSLDKYLHLPAPPPPRSKKLEEADVEGLAYADGYLWLTGSHSLKRKSPKADDDPAKTRDRLATIARDGNRYLLARIPVLAENGTYALTEKDAGSQRIAARLNGNRRGNDLTEALRRDKHLGPFLSIPGKDNGFDIEGLAVVGARIFLGLRGPVLRGWAVILEVETRELAAARHILRLKDIGPDGGLYRKHLLNLGGLGIRDLCVHGDDLLILAGPTMDLDGPVTIFRWPGGARPEAESVVPASQLKPLLEVPYGKGHDHAEGMSLFSPNGSEAPSLLVVYDAASRSRYLGGSTLVADVFPLS